MKKIDQLVQNSLVQENTKVQLDGREINNIQDLISWVQKVRDGANEQEAKDIINQSTYLLKLAFVVA